MSILLSFAPWLLYWVFLSFGMLQAAAFAGLIAALVFTLKDFFAHSVKVLTVGTLIFFLVLSSLTLLIHIGHLWVWVPLAGNATLALITLISILIKKPFTLQYARETAPKEIWDCKPFIHANYVITWAWFIAFVVMTAPDILDSLGISSPTWFKWAFSVACCALALKFTTWYRQKSRRQTQALLNPVSAASDHK